jgi:hypothetical protein
MSSPTVQLQKSINALKTPTTSYAIEEHLLVNSYVEKLQSLFISLDQKGVRWIDSAATQEKALSFN